MAKEEYSKSQKSRIPTRVLLLVLTVVVFFSFAPFSYGTDDRTVDDNKVVPISGKGAVVMDAKNGNILYSFNGTQGFNPASCTKILSAVIALEEGNLKEQLVVSEDAVYNIDYDSSHIALDVGEKITLKDAVFGMLLTSGNDCSVVVAEAISGSVDKYADKMNEKAKEIGCTDSHFTNPHGLYNKEHYTTPLDLARIMRYCIGNEKFVQIDSALKYTVPKTNKSEPRELWNNHRMLKNKYVYYEPIICGKSGYITKSKFNLVSYGKKDGMELIVVIMKEDDPTTICEDTEKLMEYYFNNYESSSIPSSQTKIESVNIDNVDVPVTMGKNMDLVVPKGVSKKDLRYETALNPTKFPIKKGTELGVVQAIYDNRVLGSTPIIAEKTIEKTSAMKVLLIVISAIVVLLFLTVLFLILTKKSRMRKRRQSRRSRTRKSTNRRTLR